MQIVHNILALNAGRQYGIINKDKEKSQEKLSSGYRINRAGDDAARLTISEKLRWQIRGLDQASENCRDGMALIDVAEGALSEVHSMLDRMKELCVQGANDTNTVSDREAIEEELTHIKEDMTRIFEDTSYNTIPSFRKKLTYVDYTDNTHTTPIGQGAVYPQGNNYGLVEVMNQAGNKNITTGTHLEDRVSFYGSGWVSSGNREPSIYTTLGSYDSAGNWNFRVTDPGTTEANMFRVYTTNFVSLPEGGSWTDQNRYNYIRHGNVLIGTSSASARDSTGAIVNATQEIKIQLKDFGDGNVFAVGYDWTVYSDNDGSKIMERKDRVLDHSGSGGSYRENGKYACAYMDFSNMGTDFQYTELDGLGFSSFCGHGCGQYYSVKFVDNSGGDYTLDRTSNGVPYSEERGQNGSMLLTFDINGFGNDGAKLVRAIVQASYASNSFDGHWEQYAYNTNEPAKLYLYENTLNVKSGSRSTWEPVARDANGNNGTIEYSVGNRVYKEDNDLHIQAGARSLQDICVQRPVMTLMEIGASSVSVYPDHETATASIQVVDDAIDKVSTARSYLGAMHNRLERAIGVDDITSENSQDAEARLRDTDMAKEMVIFSKNSILAQAGQSMIAQADQSTDGVLTLLG